MTSTSASNYNRNHSAVRRLLQEVKELASEPSDFFIAYPLEENLFEWHFTIAGPSDTCYDTGRYHGRLLLPAEYPFKPPNIILLTPNGRFEVGTKICLSITGYHPEFWQPAWGVRTAMLALISFLPTRAEGAVGAMECSDSERRKLATASRTWTCKECEAHTAGEEDYMMCDRVIPLGRIGDEGVGSSADAREDISLFRPVYPTATASTSGTTTATAAAATATTTDVEAVKATPVTSVSIDATSTATIAATTTATQRVRTRTRTRTRTATHPTAPVLAPFGLTRQQWDMAMAVACVMLALLILQRFVA